MSVAAGFDPNPNNVNPSWFTPLSHVGSPLAAPSALPLPPGVTNVSAEQVSIHLDIDNNVLASYRATHETAGVGVVASLVAGSGAGNAPGPGTIYHQPFYGPQTIGSTTETTGDGAVSIENHADSGVYNYGLRLFVGGSTPGSSAGYGESISPDVGGEGGSFFLPSLLPGADAPIEKVRLSIDALVKVTDLAPDTNATLFLNYGMVIFGGGDGDVSAGVGSSVSLESLLMDEFQHVTFSDSDNLDLKDFVVNALANPIELGVFGWEVEAILTSETDPTIIIDNITVSLEIVNIPEPASVGLLLLAGLAPRRTRRRS
jgi:hypothetical protein